MAIFNAVMFLANTLLVYVNSHCRGKAVRLRRERLMTEIFRAGRLNTRQNRKLIRRQLKDGLRPDQAVLDRYLGVFMIGKPCAFAIDDILQRLRLRL